MEAQIQTFQDYADYIKCGEILKSPLQNYKNSIVLKCFQCTDIHFLLESFVAHIEEHFKDILTLDENYKKTEYQNTHEDEIESEGVAFDISVKEELVDPLFPIKCEISKGKCSEKFDNDEINIQNSPASNKDFDTEKFDEFENIYNDSNDEFLSEEAETDVDEAITNPKTKWKKRVDEEQKSSDSDTDEDEIANDIPNKRKRKVSPIVNEFVTSKNHHVNSSKDNETEEYEIKHSPNKRKLKVSPIVDEFMKSKNNVLTLIDFYKNQPDLWNKFSPFYRLRDKRKQNFEEITQNLNKKCSLDLSWNQTAEIISYIYGKHRDDFKRIQGKKATKRKGKNSNKKQGKYEKKLDKKIKCCWFFDQLHFLRSKVIISLQNLDTNLPELTPEQIIKILEIYQSFPHLWNTYLIENICSNKRHDALAEMLNVLEINMNIKTSTTALEQYIRSIHNYYSKEKRQRLETSIGEDSTKTSSSNYYQYMTFLEDHEGPFNCSECNGLYTKPLCFRVHKSQHDGTVPLICSQCKQEFKSVASYTTHAKRHLEDLQFICKECNMKFLRHSDLKIHLLTHTDARPYCCEICGASYRQSNSFRKHQRRHEQRFSHTCHICSKGYYTKYRYIDHMNSHMNIRSYVCKICGKGFITSRALKTHSVTHEDARNHACNLCGKTFKLKIGVLQHMRTHGSKVETDDKRKIL